jgi:hypothetical protein
MKKVAKQRRLAVPNGSRARVLVRADGTETRGAFTTYRAVPSASSLRRQAKNVRKIFGSDLVDAVEARNAKDASKAPASERRRRSKSSQLANAARISSRRRTA